MEPSRSASPCALITGSGSLGGIGFAAAKQLGLDGTRVVLTSTTDRIHARVKELRSLGIEATGHVTRLDTEADVGRLFDDLRPTGTVPSIVVNNAGMTTVNDTQTDSGDILTSVDAWNKSLTSNLTTAFLVSRAAVPAMRIAGWGGSSTFPA